MKEYISFLGGTMKNRIHSIITVAAVIFALTGCASAPQKPVTVQELIKEGRYEEAKDLFMAKANINEQDEDGNTALHLAAAANESDLVSFLIIKGADTEIKNTAGDTALHIAVKKDYISTAKVLAIVHGDIFAKDADGNTALELALAKGGEWYDAMITPQTGELRDINGETIVHYFVRTKDELAVSSCIRQQIPLSVKNNAGKTPLALAFENASDFSSVRIAASLILAGSELCRGEYAYFEDAVRTHNMIIRFADGQTPLHIATINGHTGVVNYILSEKTSVRLTDILQSQDISGATPLHEAVRYGRADIARLLLAKGAQVDALDSIGKSPFLLIIPPEAQNSIYSTLFQYNASATQKDMYGDTVLHVATMGNAPVDVLNLLVSHGAGVNERNKQGVTPLSLAIEKNNTAHVVFYANHGADINAEDQNGKSPLVYALDSPTIDMLKTLVTKENILTKDSQGNTPLHIALMKDSPFEYIQYLIETGADVNARNKSGDSVLFLTVQKNNRQVGDILLERGADIFATNTQNNSPLRIALTSGGDIQDWLITSQTMNTTDGSGNTPLHYAAEWKLDSSILRLVEKGAKINAVNSNGESALFSAVKGNSPSTINTLVRAGIETDVRSNLARDHLGNTPLHYAVRWNSLDAAQTLLSMGMEVDAQNLSGKTALSDACRSSKKDMAILLMKNRADINAADATGRTVLMDSISSNNEYMVSLLLSNGANPQIQEMSGRTAYHEAAVGGNINIITKVREAGGNPLSRDSYGDSPFSLVLRSDDKIIRAVLGSNLTIVDSDGNTPVHIAIEKKVNSKILEKILSMGYQVNIRNGKGLTPLNMAVSANQKKNSLILLEHGANPFTATISGDSALTNAFKNGNIEILDAIVKYNAAKTDMQGDSILHYAARLADENICKHLVEAGLDRNARNISGETPAQMAERWNRITIAGILK